MQTEKIFTILHGPFKLLHNTISKMQATDAKTKLVIGNQYVAEVVSALDLAKISVKILMFDWRWYKDDFSNDVSLINHALVRCARRKVPVTVLTNYLNIVELLNSLGIKAKKWDNSRLMHSKGIIIDDLIVVMGSHNFTQNAMHNNVETSLVVADSNVAKSLSIYFDSLWSSS